MDEPPTLLERIELKKRFWSLPDLAKFWGVSYGIVYRAASEGDLPGCSRLPNGNYQVDSEIVTREWAPPSMRGWLGNAALEAPKPPEAPEPKVEIEITSELAQEAKAIEARVTSILNARAEIFEAPKPKPITVDERLASLSQVVTGGHWALIVRKAVNQAVAGDWRARQWLSNYLLGPPIQRLIAKVEVKEVGGFEADFRAAAIKTLLGEVRKRAEGRVIDVIPEEVEDAPS